jgi:hypothetical protein
MDTLLGELPLEDEAAGPLEGLKTMRKTAPFPVKARAEKKQLLIAMVSSICHFSCVYPSPFLPGTLEVPCLGGALVVGGEDDGGPVVPVEVEEALPAASVCPGLEGEGCCCGVC